MTARWRAEPVRGGWRLEADYHDHRLSIRRTVTGRSATILYRAYLDGQPIGYWRSKETAMTAWAARTPFQPARPLDPQVGRAPEEEGVNPRPWRRWIATSAESTPVTPAHSDHQIERMIEDEGASIRRRSGGRTIA
jgi:hypothetical protein